MDAFVRHNHKTKRNVGNSTPFSIKSISIPQKNYDYPIKCLDFSFDIYNETDDFIRIVKVSTKNT